VLGRPVVSRGSASPRLGWRLLLGVHLLRLSHRASLPMKLPASWAPSRAISGPVAFFLGERSETLSLGETWESGARPTPLASTLLPWG